jgi:CBS domain containing-hemolysin-like protein
MEDTHALDEYVATCQLGITISSLALGAFAQQYVSGQLDFASAAIVSTVVLLVFTLLQVVLGELFPKSVAVQYPETVALFVIRPVIWSQTLFRPLIWLFNGSGRLLLSLLGKEKVEGHGHLYSSQEIEMLVTESHEGGLLQDDERTMLRNAFRLKDLTARQVMVHRTRLAAEDVNSGADQLLNTSLESGHSRIPLYEGDIDNIIGFVHVKDVFRRHVAGVHDLRESLRDVVYIPEALSIVDVWEKLNTQRQYMAVVFDEYGGTAGIITQEDLIEEIFGELQDEFDEEIALVKVGKDGRVFLRGDLLVSDVNEYLHLSLPHEGADTIGGLVFTELRGQIEAGQTVEIAGVKFTVDKVDDLRVGVVSLAGSADMTIPSIGEWEVERD